MSINKLYSSIAENNLLRLLILAEVVQVICGQILRVINFFMAGLPALQDGESGQVRKEAATAIYCECRGFGSPPNTVLVSDFSDYLLV